MFTAMLNHPDVAKYDLRSLKYCGSGGAPLPLEVAQRFEQVTGCPLSEGWGMTETSPTGTFTPVYGKRKAARAAFRCRRSRSAWSTSTIRAATCALGERGELCIRGPNVMKGYWNNPEATAEATTFDGMLRTGDVAIMDEDGFVFIVDRTKDMILCSGFNVYPRNLEDAIYEHPAVAEVTVIGIPDEYRGQSPKAFVKLKPGAAPFSLAELQAFLKDRLGKHEMVQALDIRAELPKTPVGKLSKKELYEEEEKKRRAAPRNPESTAVTSSLIPDPFQMWREALDQARGQRQLARHRQHGLAGDDALGAPALDRLSLGLQQAFEKAIGSYLAKLNLPSRKDVSELAAALQRIEDKLDRLLPAARPRRRCRGRPAPVGRRPEDVGRASSAKAPPAPAAWRRPAQGRTRAAQELSDGRADDGRQGATTRR